MASNDPQFEQKAADIIGLYMNPPQHAVVFCVDEKTAIQALDRLDPVLPLSPGRAERHGFEYYRHGTLSLYAALEVKTGKVHGMTAGRHTSQEFIAFLEGLVARTPWAQQIHVVLDNLSAHKTQDVERFLAEHPLVQFHFTPTYSSWLNQWNSGSPKSSATSSPAACSLPSPISVGSCASISERIRNQPSLSAGSILTRVVESLRKIFSTPENIFLRRAQIARPGRLWAVLKILQ